MKTSTFEWWFLKLCPKWRYFAMLVWLFVCVYVKKSGAVFVSIKISCEFRIILIPYCVCWLCSEYWWWWPHISARHTGSGTEPSGPPYIFTRGKYVEILFAYVEMVLVYVTKAAQLKLLLERNKCFGTLPRPPILRAKLNKFYWGGGLPKKLR